MSTVRARRLDFKSGTSRGIKTLELTANINLFEYARRLRLRPTSGAVALPFATGGVWRRFAPSCSISLYTSGLYLKLYAWTKHDAEVDRGYQTRASSRLEIELDAAVGRRTPMRRLLRAPKRLVRNVFDPVVVVSIVKRQRRPT